MEGQPGAGYCTQCGRPLGPGWRYCHSCGAAVPPTDDLEGLAPPPAPVHDRRAYGPPGRAGAPGPPQGWAPAGPAPYAPGAKAGVADFLSSPGAAFARVQGLGLGDAFAYYFVLLLIGSVLSVPSVLLVYGRWFSFLAWMLNLPTAVLAAGVFLSSLVGGLVSVFLGGLILHLLVLICGGRAGVEQTLKAVMYAATPSLLFGWLPFVGIAGAIWGLVLSVIGMAVLHRISTGRAVVAVVVLPLSLAVISGVTLRYTVGRTVWETWLTSASAQTERKEETSGSDRDSGRTVAGDDTLRQDAWVLAEVAEGPPRRARFRRGEESSWAKVGDMLAPDYQLIDIGEGNVTVAHGDETTVVALNQAVDFEIVPQAPPPDNQPTASESYLYAADTNIHVDFTSYPPSSTPPFQTINGEPGWASGDTFLGVGWILTDDGCPGTTYLRFRPEEWYGPCSFDSNWAILHVRFGQPPREYGLTIEYFAQTAADLRVSVSSDGRNWVDTYGTLGLQKSDAMEFSAVEVNIWDALHDEETTDLYVKLQAAAQSSENGAVGVKSIELGDF